MRRRLSRPVNANAARPRQGTGSRVLAIDLGNRRVGLALSDELAITAQPAGTIPADDPDLLERIRTLCAEHGVGHVVLGLPRNMDGSEGSAARAARGFAERLRAALDLPVTEWDERLTTAAAERVLIAADVSRRRRKGVIDQLAAVLILQSFLDRLRNEGQQGAAAVGGRVRRNGSAADRGHFCVTRESGRYEGHGKAGYEVSGMEDIHTVVFRDENGEEVTFEVLDYIEVNGREYVIAAMPDEEDEAFILRVEVDENDQETYVTIEDDEEWEMVAEAYEELLAEEEGAEDEDWEADEEEDEEDSNR